MSELVIQTQGLTKSYGDFVAVDGIDLAVKKAEIFGMLGPNGSGKTTTILMLLGLTEPTAGWIRILGFDSVRQPLRVKSHVGYLPDQVGFYDRLTARENLAFIAKLNAMASEEITRRTDAALERMGLSEVADQEVHTYSHGMRQRLGVAELLIKRPQIIIMDEPTVGLDPEAARLFLGMIRDLRNEGITILLASHLLHQVQEVCDRVGLFHRGRIVLEGTVPELAQRVLGAGYRVLLTADGQSEKLSGALKALPGAARLEFQPPDHYMIDATSDLRSEAANAVVSTGGRLKSLDLDEPSLDDVYARYFEEVQHAPAA